METTKDVLNDYIYRNINRIDLTRPLNPEENKKYIVLDCSLCGGKGEAYMHHDGEVMHCNRKNKCGKNIHIWKYIKDSRGLSSNFEVFKILADSANYTLPELNSDEMLRIEDAIKRNNLIEEAQDFFKENLWYPIGKDFLKYLLEERGYSQEDIRLMNLGFNPGYADTCKYLIDKGYSKERFDEVFKWIASRDTHKLTIPYRNHKGNLINIYGRINPGLNEEEHGGKYMPYGAASKACPFNMYKVHGASEIIIVEGYLDASIADARGMKNVIGIGGSQIPQEQFKMIVESKPKCVYLALDSDNAGIKGTIDAIERFNKTSIEVRVVTLPFINPSDSNDN